MILNKASTQRDWCNCLLVQEMKNEGTEWSTSARIQLQIFWHLLARAEPVVQLKAYKDLCSHLNCIAMFCEPTE